MKSTGTEEFKIEYDSDSWRISGAKPVLSCFGSNGKTTGLVYDDVPVTFESASHTAALRQIEGAVLKCSADKAGANDYLPEPFKPDELLARVKTLANLKTPVDKAMAAEVAFMQAQIKPHFLYNTLNTISSF